MKYDFCGWATKNDLRCSDGLIIRGGAFKVQDGHKVPLVWNHQHNSVDKVLGHGILENRPEGVYVYGKFNNTPSGQHAKECLKNGDIEALSIWANNLQKEGMNVTHGAIREVSLVLAGANPGAFVESVIAHSMPMDEDEDEGIFYNNETIEVYHAENEDPPVKKEEKDKTVGEVIATLNEDQKEAVGIMISELLSEKKEKEEDEEVRHNVFDEKSGNPDGVYFLSHAETVEIINDAKENGLKLSVAYSNYLKANELQHAVPMDGMIGPSSDTSSQKYGIRDMNMLFPEYRSLNTPPEFISRDMTWVDAVLNGVVTVGFSRIKSTFANITEDEARAKGYIKGEQKKEEVFTLLQRTTEPQTIYKLQKLDRDDVIDITDFDVVAWLREEMRMMLREEKARAILIGDGRATDSKEHIKEDRIRPIAKDVDLFSVKVPVVVGTNDTASDIAEKTIDAAIRGRKQYKGSGNPTFFTTDDVVTEMLLLKDKIGHKIYKTEAELATALRVSKIETVGPMEGQKITVDKAQVELLGIIVNLSDYRIGRDKLGVEKSFEQFDIDFNQMKYLLEERFSGALVRPFSALVLYKAASGSVEAQHVYGGTSEE